MTTNMAELSEQTPSPSTSPISMESAVQLVEIVVPTVIESSPKPVITQAKFTHAAFGAITKIHEISLFRFDQSLQHFAELKHLGKYTSDNQYLVRGRETLKRINEEELARIKDQLLFIMAEQPEPTKRYTKKKIITLCSELGHFLTHDEIQVFFRILKGAPRLIHTEDDAYVYYK